MSGHMPPARCRYCPLPTLAAFSPSHEEAIARAENLRIGVRQFRDRECIFRAEDPVREAYTLFSGYAIGYRLLANGGRQVIRFILPGDLLYRLPSAGSTWTTWAMAVDHAVTCVLSLEGLNSLFQKEIRFAHDIARINDHEERLLEEHITDLGRRPAIERLGRLMLELFHRQRIRSRTNGARCPLPFTQEQIGDAVGLSTVYVSRLLGQLQNMGVLSLKARWLEIPDFDAAARQFDYSPGYIHPRPLI